MWVEDPPPIGRTREEPESCVMNLETETVAWYKRDTLRCRDVGVKGEDYSCVSDLILSGIRS